MIAEILCVGTELLLGEIVNTNAQYLAKELAKLGVPIHYQTVVGDNGDRIKAALDIAFSRANLVVITGGLGPTKDDLTKEILADYFHRPLLLDPKADEDIRNRLKKYGHHKVSESNRKQAFMPEGATILYNDWGTAPGCIIEEQGKTAILLPGPPGEMQHLFQKAAEIYIKEKSTQTFLSYNIQIEGVGESMAADRIDHLLDLSNPTVATYAGKKEPYVFASIAAATDQESITPH